MVPPFLTIGIAPVSPFTAAVMSDAEAFEIAHPLPRKLASAMTSPSMRSHTVR